MAAKKQRVAAVQASIKADTKEEPQIIEAPQEKIAETEVVVEEAVEGEEKEEE